MSDHDGPLDPDELEQRQSADRSSEGDDATADTTGEALDPDEIEQRQAVDIDEDDAPRE